MKEIKLFDYQEDMKVRIEKALCLHRSVMVQMPTGTGKTVLLASVVESFLREHPESSVWIVAHRRELVSQIKETLNKFLLNFNFPTTPSPSSSEGGDVADYAIAPSGASKVSPDCLCGVNRLGVNVASDDADDSSLFTLRSSLIKAVSIQWLSKHYDEIGEEPGMIVIDEAHHALAKTYKEMWERFPKAKFLGLTATPCRLNGKGFTDLFDVLVQSWSVPEFISKGRLATYDFVSIKSDGVTQRLIDSLQKRGADGDYQNKEMDMLLNKRPSIERLFQSFTDFAKDRKGIVYAINISHAQRIAEFYREHGVVAVAIDSKTPSSLRKELIERFKEGSTAFPKPLSPQGTGDVAGDAIALPEFWYRQRSFRPQGAADDFLTQQSCDRLCGVNRLADKQSPIQVLVNVDIFSEGFDCPDVEFVQLARPTLSLAKYLQMVGRGLRVAKGKKNCVIIDNVGLYRVFGLPSQAWDWEATFEGRLKYGRKKETPKERDFFLMKEKQEELRNYPDSEMMMVMSHEELMQSLQYREFVDSNDEFAIVKLLDGKMTVVNRQREQVIEPDNYHDMKLMKGNILFYRPKRKEVCYIDLLSKRIIDDGPNVADIPKVVTLSGWEFIKCGEIYHSRTSEDFSLPYLPSKYDLWNRGYYLRYKYHRSTSSGCQVWIYWSDGGYMQKHRENSEVACFLRGDHTHVYWLCADLYEGGIVVMDSNEDYYFVAPSLKKTYIGSNHPKNENESLVVAMPRLGKEVYEREVKRRKIQEKQDLMQSRESADAGKVELYQAGKKWGLKMDGKVVVPPLYHHIAQPVGAYCAFEQVPRHWGIMTLKGKVIVEAKYEKVEIDDNGKAIVTNITGKTQTINLR